MAVKCSASIRIPIKYRGSLEVKQASSTLVLIHNLYTQCNKISCDLCSACSSQCPLPKGEPANGLNWFSIIPCRGDAHPKFPMQNVFDAKRVCLYKKEDRELANHLAVQRLFKIRILIRESRSRNFQSIIAHLLIYIWFVVVCIILKISMSLCCLGKQVIKGHQR